MTEVLDEEEMYRCEEQGSRALLSDSVSLSNVTVP